MKGTLIVSVAVAGFVAVSGLAYAGGGDVGGTPVSKTEAAQPVAAAPQPPAKLKCVICGNAMSPNYLNKAAGRLGRGISNAAFGTCEIGAAAVDSANEKAGFWKTWDNLCWGGINFFTRTAGGIVDVMTFWEPQIHNDKMCENCAFGRSGIVDR